MPAFVTHVLFGEDVFYSLSAEEQAFIKAHPVSFFWGLQGPDLLFYTYAFWQNPNLPAFGSFLHRQRAKPLLEALHRQVDRQPQGPVQEEMQAYFWGFLCHYCLDCAAHPLIGCLQQKYEQAGCRYGVHHKLESDLDTAFYEARCNRKISSFRIPQGWDAPVSRQAIGTVYERLGREYGVPVGRWQVDTCFSCAAAVMRLAVQEPCRLPMGGIRGVEALMGRPGMIAAHLRSGEFLDGDPMNETHRPWSNLRTGQESTASFLQLYCQAKKDAVKLIELTLRRRGGELGLSDTMSSFDNGLLP